MLDVLIDWGLAMWSSAFVDSADGLSKMQAILKQHISYHITTFTICNLQFIIYNVTIFLFLLTLEYWLELKWMNMLQKECLESWVLSLAFPSLNCPFCQWFFAICSSFSCWPQSMRVSASWSVRCTVTHFNVTGWFDREDGGKKAIYVFFAKQLCSSISSSLVVAVAVAVAVVLVVEVVMNEYQPVWLMTPWPITYDIICVLVVLTNLFTTNQKLPEIMIHASWVMKCPFFFVPIHFLSESFLRPRFVFCLHIGIVCIIW